MGFFDEMLAKTKSAVNTMGKNAGNLVDSSKLKFHAAELRGDIDKSYEALGKLIYEARKNGTDATEATNQAVSAIDELYEQLDAIDSQLLKLSNKVICPSCGEKNDDSAMFCPKCGTKLEREEPAAAGSCCGCGCEGAAEAEPSSGCGCGCTPPAEEETKA